MNIVIKHHIYEEAFWIGFCLQLEEFLAYRYFDNGNGTRRQVRNHTWSKMTILRNIFKLAPNKEAVYFHKLIDFGLLINTESTVCIFVGRVNKY